jgi:hypothetical protein
LEGHKDLIVASNNTCLQELISYSLFFLHSTLRNISILNQICPISIAPMLSISDSGAANPKIGAERAPFNDADTNTFNTNKHIIAEN